MASADVKFPIKLEGLAFAHAMFANYEPELFPGLIYRMKQPKVVLLIFVSGKVVLTGAKVRRHRLLIASRMQVWGSTSLPPLWQTRDDVYTAFESIYPVLTEFRKVERGAVAAAPMALPGADVAGPSSGR